MIVYTLSLVCLYYTGFKTLNIDTGEEVFRTASKCQRNLEYNEKDFKNKCTASYKIYCKEKTLVEGK